MEPTLEAPRRRKQEVDSNVLIFLLLNSQMSHALSMYLYATSNDGKTLELREIKIVKYQKNKRINKKKPGGGKVAVSVKKKPETFIVVLLQRRRAGIAKR